MIRERFEAQPPFSELRDIDAYLQAPPPALSFTAPLERAFGEKRRRQLRASFHNDAVGAMFVAHLVGVALVTSRAVTAEEARNSFLVMHGLSCVPTLLVLVAVQRFPVLLTRVVTLSKLLFLLALVGVIGTSRTFHGEIALYQCFTLASLPVILNLMQTIAFRDAAILACFYLPAMLWNAFSHPGFSPSATWFLGFFYLMLTGVSLAANRRMEAAERLNFLAREREKLRHAEILDANNRLDALSRLDALTGLSNRRDFDERLSRAVQAAQQERRPLAVLALDIDHFKRYNDSQGHPEGDKCIRAVAGAIAKACAGPQNFVGRIGGEEFAAVLPGADVETAAAAAARIRAMVQALALPHPALGEGRVVSVSLGVARVGPTESETPEALLARADAALYRAKRAGRDRAEFDLRLTGT